MICLFKKGMYMFTIHKKKLLLLTGSMFSFASIAFGFGGATISDPRRAAGLGGSGGATVAAKPTGGGMLQHASKFSRNPALGLQLPQDLGDISALNEKELRQKIADYTKGLNPIQQKQFTGVGLSQSDKSNLSAYTKNIALLKAQLQVVEDEEAEKQAQEEETQAQAQLAAQRQAEQEAASAKMKKEFEALLQQAEEEEAAALDRQQKAQEQLRKDTAALAAVAGEDEEDEESMAVTTEQEAFDFYSKDYDNIPGARALIKKAVALLGLDLLQIYKMSDPEYSAYMKGVRNNPQYQTPQMKAAIAIIDHSVLFDDQAPEYAEDAGLDDEQIFAKYGKIIESSASGVTPSTVNIVNTATVNAAPQSLVNQAFLDQVSKLSKRQLEIALSNRQQYRSKISEEGPSQERDRRLTENSKEIQAFEAQLNVVEQEEAKQSSNFLKTQMDIAQQVLAAGASQVSFADLAKLSPGVQVTPGFMGSVQVCMWNVMKNKPSVAVGNIEDIIDIVHRAQLARN